MFAIKHMLYKKKKTSFNIEMWEIGIGTRKNGVGRRKI